VLKLNTYRDFVPDVLFDETVAVVIKFYDFAAEIKEF
jgi:hypothetical protein